jgi:uncharacterized protein DUF6916
MRELTLQDFDGREGESFELLLDETIVPVTLASVRKLPRSVRDGDSFLLEWLGPSDPTLPQGIYAFRDGDETYEMFIVPVRRDGDGTHYEAVFN